MEDGLTITIDTVELRTPAGARGMTLGSILVVVLFPLVVAALGWGAATMERRPVRENPKQCLSTTPSMRPDRCETLRPRWGAGNWVGARARQLTNVGDPKVLVDDVDLDLPPGHPSNAPFLHMADEVEVLDQRGNAKPEHLERARREHRVLTELADREYDRRLQAAIENGWPEPGGGCRQKVNSAGSATVYGIAPLLGVLALGFAVFRLRDLRPVHIRATTHDVQFDGVEIPLHDVKSMQVVGRHIRLVRKSGKTLRTSPIPFLLVDDADALCSAVEGLEKRDATGEVPDDLRDLVRRR